MASLSPSACFARSSVIWESEVWAVAYIIVRAPSSSLMLAFTFVAMYSAISSEMSSPLRCAFFCTIAILVS